MQTVIGIISIAGAFLIVMALLGIGMLIHKSRDWNKRALRLIQGVARRQQGKKLYLGSSYITVVPPEIGQLRYLEELGLNANRIANLPPEIGELRSLKSLWLEDNIELCELPEEFWKLTSLSFLALDNNRLSSLSAGLGNLTALEILRTQS